MDDKFLGTVSPLIKIIYNQTIALQDLDAKGLYVNRKYPKFLIQQIKDWAYKTLGTSIIYSPLSSPSLGVP